VTSNTARDWLPLDVARRDAVRAVVDEALSVWSRLWLPRRRIAVSAWDAVAREARTTATDGAGWRLVGSAIALSCSPRAASRVLGWALDVSLDDVVLSEADRRVIEGFEQQLFRDLVAQVERALGIAGEGRAQPLGVADPFDALGGVVASLSDSGSGALLTLAIPMAVLLPFCRRSLPRPAAATTPLVGRLAALGPAAVGLEAWLGQADLTLAELRHLAPGDVLVLDRPRDSAAEISLPGSASVFATAALTDVDGRRALVLQTQGPTSLS
jgi:hypothetical protein